MNFDRNSKKTIQRFAKNSRIPQDFESAGFRILQTVLLSFVEILKFLGIQLSVVLGEGGGDIFWNSTKDILIVLLYLSDSSTIKL